MHFAALSPVGARLTGLRVDALSAGKVSKVREALAEYGVVVIPEQDVDDAGFLRFLRSFGELAFTAGETPVPGSFELNLVTNVGRGRPPRSTFHTDTSYVRNPPVYTALRAVAIPEYGGHTLFTNQYVAYETLPARLRMQLGGRTITHVVTGIQLHHRQESAAEHPIFAVHPISGRTALYMSSPQRCADISGVAPLLVGAVVDYLFEHSTRPANVYRHQWSRGDVVMWDNRCVLHRADHRGVVGDRVMHRGMVAASG